jgi:hypothetical protein
MHLFAIATAPNIELMQMILHKYILFTYVYFDFQQFYLIIMHRYKWQCSVYSWKMLLIFKWQIRVVVRSFNLYIYIYRERERERRGWGEGV